jgi:hypothetical protein
MNGGRAKIGGAAGLCQAAAYWTGTSDFGISALFVSHSYWVSSRMRRAIELIAENASFVTLRNKFAMAHSLFYLSLHRFKRTFLLHCSDRQ